MRSSAGWGGGGGRDCSVVWLSFDQRPFLLLEDCRYHLLENQSYEVSPFHHRSSSDLFHIRDLQLREETEGRRPLEHEQVIAVSLPNSEHAHLAKR